MLLNFILNQCVIKAFTRHHDLKRHVRSIHTGLKPYQCPNCKRAFARLDALNRHLKVNGNAPCVGMKNPRKGYTKHKKNDAKNKSNASTDDTKDKKTNGDSNNDINNNNETNLNNESNSNINIPSTDSVEDNTNQSLSLTSDVNQNKISSVDVSSNVDSSISSNNDKMNNITTTSQPTMVNNQNGDIENINSQKSNTTTTHAPKKTLLPPKSLKPPQRRNNKRTKFNMNGNQNSDIVSTVIVTNKDNALTNSTGRFMPNNNNENDNIPDNSGKSKKRKITNNKSDNNLEPDLLDLATGNYKNELLYYYYI